MCSFKILYIIIASFLVAQWAPAQSPDFGALDRTTPGDEFWADEFWFLPLQGRVNVLTLDADERLYAGGSFSVKVGAEMVFANIAVREGGEWHPLGGGVNGEVDAITVAPDGSLYVGGAFTLAGGEPVARIARWSPNGSDGGSWTALGSGLGGAGARGRAIAVHPNGSVYVGGFFTEAGGEAANRVAKWVPDDGGGVWQPLGKGIGNNGVGSVQIGTDGSVFFAGSFTQAGGEPAAHIARWIPDDQNGGTWNTLGEGLDSSVQALAATPDGSLYAAGYFQGRVAKWIPDDQGGGTWSAFGHSLNRRAGALALGPEGELYVGGSFTSIGGESANRIARWTPNDTGGGSWSPLGEGLNARVATLVTSSVGALYAGGEFARTGSFTTGPAAAWDGQTWSHLVPLGNGVNNTITELAVDTQGDIIAAGQFTAVGGGIGLNRVARWDGAVWTSLDPIWHGSPSANAIAIRPDGTIYFGGRFSVYNYTNVSVLRRSPDGVWSLMMHSSQHVETIAPVPDGSLYVGGGFSGNAGSRISHWVPDDSGGGIWMPLGSGTNTTVKALALAPDGTLYVGGNFTQAGGLAANYIAAWTPESDGTGSWSTLGSGMNARVTSLVVDSEGILYAGGYFTHADGIEVGYIAAWDGSSWSPVGGGMSSGVEALAISNSGHLFAGGGFQEAGGVPASRIAYWDGDAWAPLGSGANAGVYALAATGESLYVGGVFSMTGGGLSSALGRWDGVHPAPGAPVLVVPVPAAEDVPRRPRLHWQPVEAETYTVEVSMTPDFSDDLIIGQVADNSVVVPEMLDPVETYYWRVRAESDGTHGPYSAPRAFTTTAGTTYAEPVAAGGDPIVLDDAGLTIDFSALSAPTTLLATKHDTIVVPPPDEMVVVGTTFWTLDITPTTSFEAEVCISLDVFEDGDPYPPEHLKIFRRDHVLADWIELDAVLHPESAPEWLCASSTALGEFVVAIPIAVDDSPAGPTTSATALVTAYPNPFSASTTIEIDIDREQPTRLVAYDLLGRVAGVLVDDFLPAGRHEVTWEARGLAAGIYLLRLSAGGATDTQRVVVLR